MLLSYIELCELIEQGVIDAPIANVNASSIDITLGDTFVIETETYDPNETLVELANKHTITQHSCVIPKGHNYIMAPEQFCLATSHETFNLPNNISAEYKLKSSMARSGLEHLNAGWCDAGWTNSKLTLELKNMTKYHHLMLTPGMKIGQMVFFKHTPVPDFASYAVKGRYNNQVSATISKGIQ